jgi:hypothetical protein
MKKKTMLLVTAAVAMVALAVPAAASAGGTLFHEGKEVATDSHVSIELTGRATFDIPDAASSFGCDVHSDVTLKAGHPSHGTATFEITTETCEGEGLLAGCELEDHSTNGPFTVTVTTEDFIIHDIEINNEFKPGCFVPGSQLTFDEVTATPDATGAISTVELEGDGIDHVTGLPIEATGDLSVGGGNAGTYGIG